jgi:hypothetical protein
MAWKLKLWCRDCCGDDPLGCFEGTTEIQDEEYATEREASEAGKRACDGSPYDYEVFEATAAPDQSKGGE